MYLYTVHKTIFREVFICYSDARVHANREQKKSLRNCEYKILYAVQKKTYLYVIWIYITRNERRNSPAVKYKR